MLNRRVRLPECSVHGLGARADGKTVMQVWEEIRMWRRTARRELHQKRQQLTEYDGGRAGSVILAKLSRLRALREASTIGFYWPLKGDVDVHPLVKKFVRQGK